MTTSPNLPKLLGDDVDALNSGYKVTGMCNGRVHDESTTTIEEALKVVARWNDIGIVVLKIEFYRRR